jgi:hypothetical protein
MNALILICALTVSAPDCQKATAVDVFYAPETTASLSGCLAHGMLYASQSGLVEPGTYSKVVCGPPRRSAAK